MNYEACIENKAEVSKQIIGNKGDQGHFCFMKNFLRADFQDCDFSNMLMDVEEEAEFYNVQEG